MKTNEQGYPVLDDSLHKRLFGRVGRPVADKEKLKESQRLLKNFDIPVPVDYPDNLYDGDLPLPELQGETIEEHFEAIASQFVDSYLRVAEEFATCELPRIPQLNDFVFQPGWTRYVWEGGRLSTSRVEIPLEAVFTYDTETFVMGGAFPVIGTCLSPKAAYVWLAAEMCDPRLPVEDWTQYDLIPIGTKRFVVGHNISYDRVRATEGYTLETPEPENFYFDTLSAHVAASGLAAGQRWFYNLAGKDPEELTFEQRKQLEHRPKWVNEGATNSLVNVYNFHVAKPRDFFSEGDVHYMKDDDKKIRDLFVKATDISMIAQRRDLLDYAIKDAFYTAELFQSIWPKYKYSSPSKVAMAGHFFLNGSRIPVSTQWNDWYDRTDQVYEEHGREMADICQGLLDNAVQQWRVKLNEDIKAIEGQFANPKTCEQLLEKAGLLGKDPDKVKLTDILRGLDKNDVRWMLHANDWTKGDPWLSQLNWIPRAYTGKYAFNPKWAAEYLSDPDKKITTKSQISHILLRLKWEGTPILMERGMGWCYTNEAGDVVRIPHPKGNDDNVGVLLSKDFLPDMEVERLSSDMPEAKRALDIANATSYWTSVRKRVRDRIHVGVPNPHGSEWNMMLPEILCHGTVTRRTVESLMVTMCSTKKWRIGTELKTRVQCPPGWKVVGADFDGQELQIASIYADAWDGGFIGASPMTHTILSGSKEKGTDAHTKLANAIEVDRDTAKGVGFAMLYGAGVKTIANTIKKKFRDRSDSLLRSFGQKALIYKKGNRGDNNEYVNGSDSGCYNYMENIALKSTIPTLPCLGTKISTALRPKAVGNDMHTGRINWTIQSSGAEMLAVILTASHWLAREFKIPAQFILSIHDEIWWMVPEKYAETWATVFQMAHLYSWARFQAAVGIPDVPLSRAFFSTVAIDDRLRKSVKESTVTLSNPQGDQEPDGKEYSMKQMAENGWIKKLRTRSEMINRGLI